MKKIFTLSLFSLVIILSGYTQTSTIDGAISALQAGNAAELSKYFDANVELTLPEKNDSYSKAQAQVILRDFFANNGVRGFEVKHKSENDQRGAYFIGNLISKSGKYRTTVYLRAKADKQLVKEIRFQMIE
ncbi:MAG: DUF4783 domain-containing protein [Chitinophagaceae bacterium]